MLTSPSPTNGLYVVCVFGRLPLRPRHNARGTRSAQRPNPRPQKGQATHSQGSNHFGGRVTERIFEDRTAVMTGSGRGSVYAAQHSRQLHRARVDEYGTCSVAQSWFGGTINLDYTHGTERATRRDCQHRKVSFVRQLQLRDRPNRTACGGRC